MHNFFDNKDKYNGTKDFFQIRALELSTEKMC